MARLDFNQSLHNATKRNYLQRVMDHDKAECAEVASQFGADYWDGDRRYGYGGYRYDGRWRPIAERMIAHYGLTSADRVLDVGCGKGYLLYELQSLLPGLTVAGLDISRHGLVNAKEELAGKLVRGTATRLPFASHAFDFVVSLGTFHNLSVNEVHDAFVEVERVGRGARKYVMVESYRNEREKVNLLYWQLTCKSFHAPDGWEWLGERAGYSGDYGYIYFE